MKHAQLCIGAGLMLLGAWMGMAFSTVTDATAAAKWWDLMTAFGTVGAAVAAVAVPLYQNWDRRRELDRDRAIGEFALAQAVQQTSYALLELARRWKKGGTLPKPAILASYVQQLGQLKTGLSGTLRIYVAGQLFEVATLLHAEADDRHKGKPNVRPVVAGLASYLTPTNFWDDHPRVIDTLEKLHASAQLMEAQAVARCQKLGVPEAALVGA